MTKLIALAALIIAGLAFTLRRRMTRAPEPAKLPPPGPDPEIVTTLRQRITDLTAQGLRGRITTQPADLTASRIGGPMAWPKGQTPPLTATGKPYILLAQIDLGALPPLDHFPNAGLLQIMIAPTDQYGCNFPSRQGDGFLITLHPPGTDYDEHSLPPNLTTNTPFTFADAHKQGRKLHWDKMDCPPSGLDYRLIDLVHPLPPHSDDDSALIGEVFLDLLPRRGTFDIMLGGNPDFTQSDPRDDPQFDGMVNLVAFSSLGTAFMWGDSGEACCLIPPGDLAQADLSRVVYFWDCC